VIRAHGGLIERAAQFSQLLPSVDPGDALTTTWLHAAGTVIVAGRVPYCFGLRWNDDASPGRSPGTALAWLAPLGPLGLEPIAPVPSAPGPPALRPASATFAVATSHRPSPGDARHRWRAQARRSRASGRRRRAAMPRPASPCASFDGDAALARRAATRQRVGRWELTSGSAGRGFRSVPRNGLNCDRAR
jgi:hypothetical protein